MECSVFEDLGVRILPAAQQKGGKGVQLSGEQFGQLADVDLAFAIRMPGDAGEEEFEATLENLDKNALWRDLEFVQNDAIIDYDLEMTFGSPSGQMAFLEVVGDALMDYEPAASDG